MSLLELLVKELPKLGGWPGDRTVASNGINGTVVFHSKGRAPFLMGGLNFSGIGCVSYEEYEAALAASKQPEWDGEGRPPVGVTCEHRPGDGTTENEWEVVTVLGISERPDGIFTDFWLRKEDGSSYIVRNAYRFRPIRTEAERKRKEIAQQMCNLFGNGIEIDEKEGYGKAWLDVYDAIAEGKIPGIRLTDDAGN